VGVNWEGVEKEVRRTSAYPCVNARGRYDGGRCFVCEIDNMDRVCMADKGFFGQAKPDYIMLYLRERERCRG